MDGDDYPEDTECKVTFRVPAQHNWEITSIYDFDVNGDYANGCEGGDYVQFTVNGKKSKKLCGEGWELSDEWCWSRCVDRGEDRGDHFLSGVGGVGGMVDMRGLPCPH